MAEPNNITYHYHPRYPPDNPEYIHQAQVIKVPEIGVLQSSYDLLTLDCHRTACKLF